MQSNRVSPHFQSQPGNTTFREAFDNWIVPHSAIAVRTAALRDIGGYCEAERLSIDYDMTLRLSYRFSFVSGDRVTVWWRWHPGQLSSYYQPQQRLAVRRHRARFVRWLREQGNTKLATELEHRAFQLWLRDLIYFGQSLHLLLAHLSEKAGFRNGPLPFPVLAKRYTRAVIRIIYHAPFGKPLRAINRQAKNFFRNLAGPTAQAKAAAPYAFEE